MSDIKELLQHTAQSAERIPSAELIDADVHRGRAALVRRRRRRAIRSSVIGVAAAAALVGTTFVVVDLDGTGDNDVAFLPDRIESTETGPEIQLVAYTGEQLDGFLVYRVPEGWFLQGSSPFSLTIAPEGDESHPDNFTGKLVVMLLSSGAEQKLPAGEPVKVGGRDGVITRNQPDSAVLTYADGEGHFVQVQSPSVLGWTNDQLTQFAEGVQVTANAKQGRG